MKKALLVLAFLLPCAAAAQDLDRTMMLVATPDLDGAYRHTALIVMPVGEERHLGFILNRASPVRIATSPLYFGGPQMPQAVFAMVRKDPGKPSLHLFGDVYVTGDEASVERIAGESGAARFFAGFVGWESGELADEIAAGYWYVAEPDAAQVFSKEPGENLWSDLVRRMGRRVQTRLY
ncbi:MAG: putative transcriptional regulator [Betaproteobacteria bacterium]|nr:putative transcriptional regulator [Betaproteobacteria bacterium]